MRCSTDQVEKLSLRAGDDAEALAARVEAVIDHSVECSSVAQEEREHNGVPAEQALECVRCADVLTKTLGSLDSASLDEHVLSASCMALQNLTSHAMASLCRMPPVHACIVASLRRCVDILPQAFHTFQRELLMIMASLTRFHAAYIEGIDELVETLLGAAPLGIEATPQIRNNCQRQLFETVVLCCQYAARCSSDQENLDGSRRLASLVSRSVVCGTRSDKGHGGETSPIPLMLANLAERICRTQIPAAEVDSVPEVRALLFLTKKIGHKSFTVRTTIFECLARVQLEDPEYKHRIFAVRVMTEIFGFERKPVIQRLIKVLQSDPTMGVRTAALEALCKCAEQLHLKYGVADNSGNTANALKDQERLLLQISESLRSASQQDPAPKIRAHGTHCTL